MPRINERNGVLKVQLYSDEQNSLCKAADTIHSLRHIDEDFKGLAEWLRRIAKTYADFEERPLIGDTKDGPAE